MRLFYTSTSWPKLVSMSKLSKKISKRLKLLITNHLPHTFFDYLESRFNPYPPTLSTSAQSGYSIVIITGGEDLPMLRSVLESIDQELSGQRAEIILIAPPNFQLDYSLQIPIRIIAYRDLPFLMPLITRKKNLGVRLAIYDKAVVMHDYLIFQAGWHDAWQHYGDQFDLAVNCIEDQDGTRFRDWLVLDYPGVGAGFLPYHAEATTYQYISGTYFVVKRDFYLANPLDDYRRWGEAEDIEWSKRIRTKTTFKFNDQAVVRCAKFKGPMLVWSDNNLALEKIFNSK